MYECDVCGASGERYTITFPAPDGTLALDRCEKHARKILSFKDEKGSWAQANGRSTFKVTTLEDISQQRKK